MEDGEAGARAVDAGGCEQEKGEPRRRQSRRPKTGPGEEALQTARCRVPPGGREAGEQ